MTLIFNCENVLTEEQKNEVKALIDNNDYQGAIDKIDIYKDAMTFASRAYGWQVNFWANGWERYNDMVSLQEFLKDRRIFDNTGKEYTYNEFWFMVQDWNANPNNKMTYEEYFNLYPDEKYNVPYNFMEAQKVDKRFINY